MLLVRNLPYRFFFLLTRRHIRFLHASYAFPGETRAVDGWPPEKMGVELQRNMKCPKRSSDSFQVYKTFHPIRPQALGWRSLQTVSHKGLSMLTNKSLKFILNQLIKHVLVLGVEKT